MTQTPATPDPAADARAKAEARAEDVAYTLNHALACTATDFIDPYVGHLTQRWLGKKYSIGCGHDHSHDHGHDYKHDHHHGHIHDHHHHDHAHPPQSQLKHWMIGEFAGDFGAVPATIAVQRAFPGAMEGIKGMMEPLLGGLFRGGAERAARKWAREENISTDSPEYRERVESIYRHEVDHLPQALLWTASSIAINLSTQRALGNTAPLWQLATAKASGAAISAGLVVGARGLMPQAARDWDRFTSRNLFLPATRALSGLAGTTPEAVERMAKKEEVYQAQSWGERVEGERHAAAAPEAALSY